VINSWKTVAVVVSGVAVFGLAVALKADREMIAALAAAFVAVAGAMAPMLGGGDK
jgi:hypothetical protein